MTPISHSDRHKFQQDAREQGFLASEAIVRAVETLYHKNLTTAGEYRSAAEELRELADRVEGIGNWLQEQTGERGK